MATVVKLPRSPNTSASVGALAGSIVGSKINEARRKKRAEAMLQSMGEIFPELGNLDSETKSELIASGAVSDLNDVQNLLAAKRAQSQEQRQEELHPLNVEAKEGQIESQDQRRRLRERRDERAEDQQERQAETHERTERQARETEVILTHPETGRQRTAIVSRDVSRGEAPLPKRFKDQGFVIGEPGEQEVEGQSLYADKPELELVGFGTERQRAAGEQTGLTFQEWKAKYPESARTNKLSEAEKERLNLIESRGLKDTPLNRNKARIEIEEWPHIKQQISEGFAERFGENFNFTQQGKRLNERALQIADDILWQSESAMGPGDVATQAVQQAQRELGGVEEGDPESQLEDIRRSGQQAESPEEEGGAFSGLTNMFGGGTEDQTQTPRTDPLRSAESKARELPDDAVDTLSDQITFGRYKDAIRTLEGQGFTTQEAREYVLQLAEETSPYGQ